jgi:hypothetical protein
MLEDKMRGLIVGFAGGVGIVLILALILMPLFIVAHFVIKYW